MKRILTLVALLTFGTLSSCQQENLTNEEIQNLELDEKSAQLIEADNTFGLEIFQKIRETSNSENIMISPLSISVAFAMAYNGADSDTKTEMENAMKLNGLTTDQINDAYKMLIKGLQSLDKDVVFEIANAIFYADGFSVKPDFLNINKTVYNAEVENLNFSSGSAVQDINNWVANKTHDKITSIIQQLNPLDRMVLLNAIYFNGVWTNKFDEKGTHQLSFIKTDGSSFEVPMMKKEEKLEYATNSLFNAIKMPYGNGQYNMIVLLPENGKNSQDIINELSSKNWKSWMTSFEIKSPVVVTMPRFKFAFETKLKNVLTQMGMEKAFQPYVADFLKMSDEDLYISSAIHKSFIDVNENGTEAAAVTSITMATTSIGNEPPKTYFNVNKPFVFAITEKDTDAILFMGEVQNPVYD
jgi:serine protease inhibitor